MSNPDKNGETVFTVYDAQASPSRSVRPHLETPEKKHRRLTLEMLEDCLTLLKGRDYDPEVQARHMAGMLEAHVAYL
jgi:hypothetical protein